MKLILTATLILTVLFADAQQLLNDHVRYGRIKNWNNPEAEFYYTNTTDKEQRFLSIAYSTSLRISVDDLVLQPGQSTTIRVQYFTSAFGRFDQKIKVYVNSMDQPIVLRISGRIRSFHPDAFEVCPTMGATLPAKPEFNHQITVVDDLTGELLPDFQITIRSRNLEIDERSSKAIFHLNQFLPDLYRIEVDKDGYELAEELRYINRNSDQTIIRLKRSIVHEEVTTTEEEIAREEPVRVEKPEAVEELEVPEPETVDSSVEEITQDAGLKDSSDLVQGQLNTEKYQYNSIVFVIDVSSSMNKPDKLPLLKLAMSRLIGVLRPEDRVSILTYSNTVEVLAEGISGDQKALLQSVILSLEAKGPSYGSEALKDAYALARSNFVGGGNNELILASDGLFNSEKFSRSREYRRARYQSWRHDVRLTTIGFGKSTHALEFLETLSERGQGDFIQIKSEAEANTELIDNLMRHSRK